MYSRSLLVALCLLASTSPALPQSGKALLLGGNGAYLSVPDHAALGIGPGESFTLTCQVKGTASAQYYRLISKRATGSQPDPGYELITNVGTGEFGINLRSTAGTNAGPPFGSTSVTDGAWHHLAMVVDAAAGTSMIYVDGVLEGTKSSPAIGTEDFRSGTDLFVGTSAALDFFWSGLLDDLRLWSTAFDMAAVQADATATLDGDEPFLVAAWDFEDPAGTTVADLTGQYSGTLHGGAQCIDPANPGLTLTNIHSYWPTFPTGRGETDERLVSVNLQALGSGGALPVSGWHFRLHPDAEASALGTVRFYANGSAEGLDPATAQLLWEGSFANGEVHIPAQMDLAAGDNVFWLCADILGDASEGALVGAWLEGLSLNGSDTTFTLPTEAGTRPVLLAHKLLFSGGDHGSGHYRIPALAAVGQRLVAVADARINNNGDLPGNIDLFARYSDDGGHTWSAPVTVADFGNNGASDPALVYDRNSGDLLCLFASHNGLFLSNPNNKIRFNVARSSDLGATWQAPQEFSDQIYQPGWYAAWVASGSALQMSDGRIAAAIGVRQNSGNTLSNFMIYSDDGGHSWHTAPGQASPVGDEAKVMELDDGRLLMAIRSPGHRKMTWSNDGGNSWSLPVIAPELVEPGVNGDLIRYTSVNLGHDTSRLLFSIASDPSVRRNLTVFVSYDEGESWGTSRVVCPGPAAYSALAALDDGTIGLFYENGEYENYQLYFARFSLDWLTDGADSWTGPTAVFPLPQGTPQVFHANGQLHVQVQGPGLLEVRDLTGKLVLRMEGMQYRPIPFGDQPPGIYLATWVQEGTRSTVRFEVY